MTYLLCMRWGRLVGLVACVALIAACGGGGGTDAASTTVAGAGVTSSTLPSTTAPPVSDTTPASLDPATTSTLPPADETPVEPVAPEPDAIQPPPAGTYTYANAGETRVTGCTVLREPAPPTSTVTYEEPAGSRQRNVSDQGGAGGRNMIVLEYRADGVYLVQLKQETQAFTADFQPAEPVLVAPRTPSVGQVIQFVLTSTDGSLTADTTITVQSVGDAATLGDGTPVTVSRMLRAAHITGRVPLGNVDIQADVLDSISQELRMSAHSVSDTNGSIGLCNVSSHVESTLQSGTPA